MKKALVLCLFFLISFAVGAVPLDFVVLLDISESMLPFFDDTINYLIGDLLKQHLVESDGFHLLTFADYPEIEMTLDVNGEREVSMALDRVVLLHPLGQYTDLVSALQFVYSYTSTVREDSSKKILILTDGIHDPPPGSPYPVTANVYKEVTSEVADKIKKKGWDITLVQFPVSIAAPADAGTGDSGSTATETGTGAAASAAASSAASAGNTEASTEGVDLYTGLSEDLDVEVLPYDGSAEVGTHGALGAPELVFPEDLGRVGYSFNLPLIVRNTTGEKILVELSEMIWNGVDILRKPARVMIMPDKSRKLRAKVVFPGSVDPGPMNVELTAGFADDLRIYPRTGMVSLTLRGTRTSADRQPLNVLPVLGYTALGLGGIVVLTFFVFALRSLLLRIFSSTGLPASRGSMGKIRERAIEMHVEGQNRNIGTRNVNYIRKNGSATVGGGFSTFLIYMYKLPSRIGLISRKGNSYTFKQVKPDYFKSDERTVNDCLGKEIVVLSEKGRPIKITFRRYVSELERINNIMRLVKATREESLE